MSVDGTGIRPSDGARRVALMLAMPSAFDQQMADHRRRTAIRRAVAGPACSLYLYSLTNRDYLLAKTRMATMILHHIKAKNGRNSDFSAWPLVASHAARYTEARVDSLFRLMLSSKTIGTQAQIPGACVWTQSRA